VTGPSASAAARAAGSNSSIRCVTAATPHSTARHCPVVIRRATPAAVVELSPGTVLRLPPDHGLLAEILARLRALPAMP
jgi:hypothetical protein